ncbi:hypothetical protein [Nostoc sp.]|uniref:hypothetical protein n=1 Tax=Nostoc sp. TaxID=1180 RepID=UPI002FFA462D
MGSEGDEGDNAQCPMPNAQCPMPNAQCPMPQSEVIRLQHLSGTSEGKIASSVLIWDASC